MEANKFEGLVSKALEKFESQGAEISEMRSAYDKEIARLAGQVETLTALNPAGPRFIQRSRGIEVPWESREHAVEFTRFMKAVARKDEQYIMKAGPAANENNQGDGGGGSEADGGYLVPVEFKPTLLRIVEQYGQARQEFQMVPMIRDEMQFPVYNDTWKDESNGSTGPTYWVSENTDTTMSYPQFANVTMTCRKLAALIPTSNELLQDSAIPIATLIATLVGEAFAKEEDRVGFVGTTGGDEKMNGVLPSAGKTVTIAGTNINTVTAADLLDMTTTLARGSLNGAKFYMHRSIFSFIRLLKDDNGQPIYNPIAVNAPGTIWGYPYTLVESLPAFAGVEANKRFILFGNLKNMLFGDRMSMNVASTDLVGFAAFQTHFRFMERIGFKLALPNTVCALKTHA